MIESKLSLRVASWNLFHRVKAGAKAEADLLRDLAPDLALLQEANASSIDSLAQGAGFDWVRWTKLNAQDQRAGSGYLAAIAGRGKAPEWVSPRFDVPFPDRVTAARVRVGSATLIAASYHAPPGESWGAEKAQQAVTFARWLADQREQFVLGADANTPKVDHPDFASTLTHWRTGVKGLRGELGDDLLWGPAKVHGLEDAFRIALANDPARLQEIRDLGPTGPLAVSYKTHRRMGKPSTPWRFDGIWVTSGLRVLSVRYLYEQGIEAGSDHAVVVADLELSAAEAALA